MKTRKVLILILLANLLISFACKYIVLPQGIELEEINVEKTGWSAFVTDVGVSEEGDLHIDIAIQNNTGDWSAMKATEGKPVVITSGGQTSNCDTVFVSTGGHRLAPGFQMRGYFTGTKWEPVLQYIYVECADVEVQPGSTLSIPYFYVTGQYNYYEQDKNKVDDKLELNLDEIVTDLVYPVAEPVEGLVQSPAVEIIALNKVVLTLLDVQRVDEKFQFSWQTANPGEYQTYVHIGNPPVIGDDGILYGFYETPDIVDTPITPAGGIAEWTNEVAVPEDVKGFYIMLSVESGKARLFANYAIDITDY
ncbi:MAG: hypothetical protein PVF83_04520 [Anaerolineales bacterium]|jgi:hypothetical protein